MLTFNSSDDSHEFKPLLAEIEDRPLNPLGRTLFWVIISAILFTGLWMFFGKIDVVVTARGKVVPKGEVKTIQPLNKGIVSAIMIQPGDYVSKGQVLMEIDPSDVDPELASFRSDRSQVALDIDRINALLENRPFNPNVKAYDLELIRVQIQLYKSEKQRLKLEIGLKQETMAQLNERLAAELTAVEHVKYMTNILADKFRRIQNVKDIITRDEYDQAESELNQYRTELKASVHHIEELKAMKIQTGQEMQFIREKFRNELLEALSQKKQRSLYLNAQIKKTEFISTRQQILSPVDGHVSQLYFHTVGGVVTPAEKLASIVPTETPLQIKALLLSRDAGFVSAGMPASIKIDTFNFQKYGTLNGRVAQVSGDSVEDERLGLVYEIYIEPGEEPLMVEGRPIPISSGMGGAAEIKVGQRRIIEFFIYPLIKHLDEGMSVK